MGRNRHILAGIDMSSAHLEQSFEDHIVEHLAANGYRRGNSSDYDRERAFMADEVVEFVETTQSTLGDAWVSRRGYLSTEVVRTRDGAL